MILLHCKEKRLYSYYIKTTIVYIYFGYTVEIIAEAAIFLFIFFSIPEDWASCEYKKLRKMPPKGWRKKPIPEAIPTSKCIPPPPSSPCILFTCILIEGVKRSLRGGTSQTVQAKSSKKNEQVDKKKAIIHQGVVWNKLDCAPQLYLSKDALTAWGEKGFRMVRANVGVREGCWYYECEILPSQGHVRLGWGAITGELEAPVGYDSWSYGFRDVNGARIHRSERYDGYGSSFGPGDVVGCAIYLQDESSNNAYSSSFGVQDSSSGDNKTFIKFFVNGVDQVPHPHPLVYYVCNI